MYVDAVGSCTISQKLKQSSGECLYIFIIFAILLFLQYELLPDSAQKGLITNLLRRQNLTQNYA